MRRNPGGWVEKETYYQINERRFSSSSSSFLTHYRLCVFVFFSLLSGYRKFRSLFTEICNVFFIGDDRVTPREEGRMRLFVCVVEAASFFGSMPQFPASSGVFRRYCSRQDSRRNQRFIGYIMDERKRLFHPRELFSNSHFGGVTLLSLLPHHHRRHLYTYPVLGYLWFFYQVSQVCSDMNGRFFHFSVALKNFPRRFEKGEIISRQF